MKYLDVDLFSFQVFGDLLVNFVIHFQCDSVVVRELILYVFSTLKFFFFGPGYGLYVLLILENNISSAVLVLNVLSVLLRSCRLMAQPSIILLFCIFNSFLFSLTSITKRRVSSFSTILIGLSISSFSFVSFCFMYIAALFLGSHMFKIVMSS